MDEELLRLLNLANESLYVYYKTGDVLDGAVATLSGAQLYRRMQVLDKQDKYTGKPAQS